MKTFTNLRIEVVTDPRDAKCVMGSDQYISIRGDLPELPEGERGLNHVWFVITRTELYQIVAEGFWKELRDGYHRLTVSGDVATFYNMDALDGSRVSRGEAKIPFYRAHIPRQAWRIIQRLAQRAWAGQKAAYLAGTSRYDVPRVVLELTQPMRERWDDLYGQGKGQVDVEVMPSTQEDTGAVFKERMTAPAGPNERPFHESIDRLKAIASNMTFARYHVAKVVLHKDLDGYYFGFLNHHGRPDGLRGGVVNHGAREGKQDWSIHT